MSALVDRITAVLREHDLKTEVWSWFECECGADVDSYQEWQAHVAERVAAELVEQMNEMAQDLDRRAHAVNEQQEPAGWLLGWEAKGIRRVMAAWSEVQP